MSSISDYDTSSMSHKSMKNNKLMWGIRVPILLRAVHHHRTQGTGPGADAHLCRLWQQGNKKDQHSETGRSLLQRIMPNDRRGLSPPSIPVFMVIE